MVSFSRGQFNTPLFSSLNCGMVHHVKRVYTYVRSRKGLTPVLSRLLTKPGLCHAEIIPEQNASKIVKKYLNRWQSYVENKSGLLFSGAHGV